MLNKKKLFIVLEPNKNTKKKAPNKNELFLVEIGKRMNNACDVKSKKEEIYTIEIDSNSENEIKTNLYNDGKSIDDNNCQLQNDINNEQISSK